jgi:hypothetical protein
MPALDLRSLPEAIPKIRLFNTPYFSILTLQSACSCSNGHSHSGCAFPSSTSNTSSMPHLWLKRNRFFAKMFGKSGPGGGASLTSSPSRFVKLPGGGVSGATKVLCFSESHKLMKQGKVTMAMEPCNWYLLKVGDEFGIQYTGEGTFPSLDGKHRFGVQKITL